MGSLGIAAHNALDAPHSGFPERSEGCGAIGAHRGIVDYRLHRGRNSGLNTLHADYLILGWPDARVPIANGAPNIVGDFGCSGNLH